MEAIAFVDSAGLTHSLDVSEGAGGRYMPPVSFVEDEVPGQDGSRLRLVKLGPREVGLPLWFRTDDEVTLRDELRSWLSRFNPAKGDGRLLDTAPDGSQRELICRYAGGMELDESAQVAGLNWQKAVVVFRAFDPFWQDTVDTAHSFATTAPVNFFPFFPLRLSAGAVLSGASIFNGGDVEAWPTWVINGPATSIVLTNDTTGDVIDLDVSLTAGQSLTIDTRPGIKTVKKNDGTNLYPGLSLASRLWSLPPGTVAVSIQVGGATSTSTVTLRYRCRYLGV
jgi:phage-related protein